MSSSYLRERQEKDEVATIQTTKMQLNLRKKPRLHILKLCVRIDKLPTTGKTTNPSLTVKARECVLNVESGTTRKLGSIVITVIVKQQLSI